MLGFLLFVITKILSVSRYSTTRSAVTGPLPPTHTGPKLYWHGTRKIQASKCRSWLKINKILRMSFLKTFQRRVRVWNGIFRIILFKCQVISSRFCKILGHRWGVLVAEFQKSLWPQPQGRGQPVGGVLSEVRMSRGLIRWHDTFKELQKWYFRYMSRDDEGVISGTSDLSGGVDCERAERGPNYQVT